MMSVAVGGSAQRGVKCPQSVVGISRKGVLLHCATQNFNPRAVVSIGRQRLIPTTVAAAATASPALDPGAPSSSAGTAAQYCAPPGVESRSEQQLRGQDAPAPWVPPVGRPGLYDSEGRLVLKALTLPELEAWCAAEGEAAPANRALQIWRWMYADPPAGSWVRSLEETVGRQNGFSAKFVEKVSPRVTLDGGLQLEQVVRAADGTRKMVFRLTGGEAAGGSVETVLIPIVRQQGLRDRLTICVSSQVGCAMNCQFCYTGRMGLLGNLTTAQIVEQVVEARRFLALEGDRTQLTNMVFMGMGEPLHNTEAVLAAADIVSHYMGLHISHNKITISTVGLVPEMRRVLSRSRVQMALSLHATTDEVRDWIVPVNRRYDLAILTAALEELFPRLPIPPRESTEGPPAALPPQPSLEAAAGQPAAPGEPQERPLAHQDHHNHPQQQYHHPPQQQQREQQQQHDGVAPEAATAATRWLPPLGIPVSPSPSSSSASPSSGYCSSTSSSPSPPAQHHAASASLSSSPDCTAAQPHPAAATAAPAPSVGTVAAAAAPPPPAAAAAAVAGSPPGHGFSSPPPDAGPATCGPAPGSGNTGHNQHITSCSSGAPEAASEGKPSSSSGDSGSFTITASTAARANSSASSNGGGGGAAAGGRSLLVEYTMLRGINDTQEDAERLVAMLSRVNCKVNLIAFNPHAGTRFQPSLPDDVAAFRSTLVQRGMVCTIRDSRGDDEMAACGQLGNVGLAFRPSPILDAPEKFRPFLLQPLEPVAAATN